MCGTVEGRRANMVSLITMCFLVLAMAANIEGVTIVKQIQEQFHKKLPTLKAAAIPSSMADEIFFQILSYYAPVDADSPRCRNDSGKYVEAALNNDFWALQMFDASSKLEAGTMEGNAQGLGNYDACLRIDTPVGFIGQLCMVEIVGISVPAMDAILSEKDEAVIPILPFNPMISLCVPSTCSYKDVEVHMNVALGPLNGTARVLPRSCSTRNPEPWEKKDYMAISVVVGLVGLVLLATFSDWFSYSIAKVHTKGLLSSFSLYRNLPKLSTKRNENEFSMLHGLRFFSITWIVIAHRYLQGFTVPHFNWVNLEGHIGDYAFAPLHNLVLGVEVFLVLSGLLVTYSFLKSMEDNKSFNVPKFYFHRYMRITPVYAMMILIDGVILYHLSDGPLWKRITGGHRDVCSDNWWTGLLYITNYFHINTIRPCVAQSWYVNTDMQLYLLSPLLLIPLHKRPKLGLSLIFGCFVATILASFLNANYYELKGGIITLSRETDKNFDLEYTKTHVRSASYFMGIGLGYFVYKYKQGLLKVNLSKVTLLFGWLVSSVLMISVIFSVTIFQQHEFKASQFVHSLYIALYRPIFSIGLVWVIFVCITGNGGFVNKMFSMPIFKLLSTLTYGIYMTHFTFQTLEISRTRLPVDYTLFDVITKGTMDIVVSIAAAFVMFLVVEAPFVEVDKWLFSKGDESEPEERSLSIQGNDKTHL